MTICQRLRTADEIRDAMLVDLAERARVVRPDARPDIAYPSMLWLLADAMARQVEIECREAKRGAVEG